ncbi:MAG: hypothetical protein H6724_06100 [Sandaracinus sp.]|nr:hypothetical protein [Sandaracinus sp.]
MIERSRPRCRVSCAAWGALLVAATPVVLAWGVLGLASVVTFLAASLWVFVVLRLASIVARRVLRRGVPDVGFEEAAVVTAGLLFVALCVGGVWLGASTGSVALFIGALMLLVAAAAGLGRFLRLEEPRVIHVT